MRRTQLLALGLQLLLGRFRLAAAFVTAEDLINHIRGTIMPAGKALPDGVGIISYGSDVNHGEKIRIRTVQRGEFTRKL